MKKANANPTLAIFLIITAFLLGISIVLNFWISGEYLKLSKEYHNIADKSKNENKEIERKWLIDPNNIPYDLEKDAKKYELTQTYLNFSPEMRIRNINDSRYVLTIKTGLTETSGLERGETEYDITKDEYEHLLSKQEGSTIHKTRYQIKVDNYTYAFDIFHQQLDGLAYLEIEFPSTEEANNFQAPNWIGRDVTNDIEYKNQKLAQNGIPTSFKDYTK